MPSIVHLKNARLGISQQSGWDTGTGTASTSFLAMNASGDVSYDLGIINDTDERINGTSMAGEQSRNYTDVTSAPKTVSFTSIAHVDRIKHILAALSPSTVETQQVESVNTTSGNTSISVNDGDNFAVGQTISILGVTFGGASTTTIAAVDTGTDTLTLTTAPDQSETDVDLTVSEYVMQCYPPAVTSVPDYASGDGTLYTFAIERVNDGSSHGDGLLFYNGICSSMTITVPFDEQGIARQATINCTFIFSDYDSGQRFTGTWTSPNAITQSANGYPAGATEKWYSYFSWSSKTYDGTLFVRSFELTWDNQVEPRGGGGGGKAVDWKIDPTISGSFTAYYSDSSTGSNAIVNAVASGESLSFNIRTPNPLPGTGKGKVNGSILIKNTVNFCENPEVSVDSKYHTITVPFQVKYPTAGWGEGIIRCANMTDTI